MKNEKLIQAARNLRETQYETPCLANGAAHSEDYSRRVERLINKTDKSRLSFLFTSGTARVAAAALALVIVAAAVFAIPAVRGMSGKNSVTEDANILYRSENGDFVVRKVEPLEKPIYYNLEWSELSEERFKSIPEVVTGTITDISEISVSYEYMGQGVITDYYSLLTVAVNDTITGELTKGKTVKVIFELSSYQMDESNIYPEVGKEYVFFIRDTSTLGKAYDYSTIAEYTYCVRPTCLVPIDEPQDPEYLAFIGAEEGTCGKDFVEALKNYYK